MPSTQYTPDDPARVAAPGELWSDAPYVEPHLSDDQCRCEGCGVAPVYPADTLCDSCLRISYPLHGEIYP